MGFDDVSSLLLVLSFRIMSQSWRAMAHLSCDFFIYICIQGILVGCCIISANVSSVLLMTSAGRVMETFVL